MDIHGQYQMQTPEPAQGKSYFNKVSLDIVPDEERCNRHGYVYVAMNQDTKAFLCNSCIFVSVPLTSNFDVKFCVYS
jgi:hypothetical protein